MGNKPSAPQPVISNIETAPTTTAPAPEIVVCDANCQQQKKLTSLRTALDSATANRVSDPETYQKARVNYYTALEGPGWLDKERERISQEEVGPEIIKLTDKYNSLVNEKKSQSMFVGLIDVFKTENEQNKQELKYAYDQTSQNLDKKITTDRTNELGNISISFSYYPLLFKILIGILIVIIIVKLYKRFVPEIPSTTTAIGGKRLPH